MKQATRNRIGAHAGLIRGREAFTLLEAMVATALVAVFLASIFVLNSQSLRMLRNSKEAASASQILQQRVEQLRIANWLQVTDADFLAGGQFLGTPLLAAQGMDGLEERVTVRAFDPETLAVKNGVQAIVVRRSSSGVNVISSNPTMSSEDVVRVDFSVDWRGMGGRERLREASMLTSQGGVRR